MHRAAHPRSARAPLLVLALVIAIGAVTCIRVHHAGARPAAAARGGGAARGAVSAGAAHRADRVSR